MHCINGTKDHIHALVLLNPMMSVTDVAKQVKGHTSYWINHNDVVTEKFSWEKGFASFSISEGATTSSPTPVSRPWPGSWG